MEMEGRTPGLRERKKRAARDAIAAAARGLFAERGYDAVTVAEIAVAADVSEKTVFNHFATKEDLAFAGREDRHAALLAALAARADGAPVLDVFRSATRELLDEVTGAGDDALPGIVAGSRALQARLAAGWEDEAAALAAAIAPDADLTASAVTRALAWTHRAVLRAALAGLAAGEDPAALRDRLAREADRAYDQLAHGLADYGGAPCAS